MSREPSSAPARRGRGRPVSGGSGNRYAAFSSSLIQLIASFPALTCYRIRASRSAGAGPGCPLGLPRRRCCRIPRHRGSPLNAALGLIDAATDLRARVVPRVGAGRSRRSRTPRLQRQRLPPSFDLGAPRACAARRCVAAHCHGRLSLVDVRCGFAVVRKPDSRGLGPRCIGRRRSTDERAGLAPSPRSERPGLRWRTGLRREPSWPWQPVAFVPMHSAGHASDVALPRVVLSADVAEAGTGGRSCD